MNGRSWRPAAALASSFLGVFACVAWAGTGTLTATATVGTNCTVSTGPLGFGPYDPILAHVSSALTGTSSITVACVKGTAPTIGMGLGLNPSGGTRRMTNGADFLAYRLYQPPNTNPGTACAAVGTTVWGPSDPDLFRPAAAANKNSRLFNVCGTVPAGQNVEVGAYSDTVIATVTF